MAWVKIDDQMPHHPKLVGAGSDAFALDVAALCYSNRLRTRGFIPEGMLAAVLPGLRSPKKAASALEDAGRWDRDDEAGGWWIHDYDEYQPTPEEVEERSKKNERAGSKGNHVRWHIKENRVDEDCAWCRKSVANGSHPASQNDRKMRSDSIANGSHDARAARSQGDSHSDRPVPVPVPDTTTTPPTPPPESDPTPLPARKNTTMIRDPIWRALVDLHGPPDGRRDEFEEAWTFLAEAGATPEELHRRAAELVKRWSRGKPEPVMFRPRVWKRHWHSFDGAIAQLTSADIDQHDYAQRSAQRLAAIREANS